ncbi:hypothetical protein DINM_022740 [Dirofilaria immitis]|nr:hypothetical protein [Dirofilaria immitis]
MSVESSSSRWRTVSMTIGGDDCEDETDVNDLRESLRAWSSLASPSSSAVEQQVFVEEVFIEKKPKILNGYLFGERIGEGSYGKVKEVLEQDTLVRRAVKIIKEARLRKIPNGHANVEQELRILKRVRHRNVIALRDFFRIDDKQKLYMVLEYCIGSMQQLLDGSKEKNCRNIKHSVIHKDIKPGNLLVALDGTLKISDFGVAEMLDTFQAEDWCTVVQGTPKFQPPEIVSGTSENYRGRKVDIWACGITLYNMVSGEYPFEGDVIMRLFDNIANQPLQMPHNDKLRRVAISACNNVPAHRPLSIFVQLNQLYGSVLGEDDRSHSSEYPQNMVSTVIIEPLSEDRHVGEQHGIKGRQQIRDIPYVLVIPFLWTAENIWYKVERVKAAAYVLYKSVHRPNYSIREDCGNVTLLQSITTNNWRRDHFMIRNSQFSFESSKRMSVVNVYATSATTENLSRHEMLMMGKRLSAFTDFLFPGSIQLRRVKWNSRLELDWLSNWKLLQTSWKTLGVDKIVPVEKLIKENSRFAFLQDNFEFLQWFKKFFDANFDGHEYDPLDARGGEPLPSDVKANAPSRMPARSSVPPVKKSTLSTSNASMNKGEVRKTAVVGGKVNSTRTAAPPVTATAAKAVAHPIQPAVDPQVVANLKRELEEVKEQVAEGDNERDFYFSKLRQIEVICQDNEQIGTVDVARVLAILYETEEGFAPPDENEVENGDEVY